MNSRARIIPARGRGSSRHLVWIWKTSLRELAVRADLARGQGGDHLLVGHGEHHLAGRAGRESVSARRRSPGSGRSAARARPGARRASTARRRRWRIDLLAQDLLDVQHRLPAEREVGEDALARAGGRNRPAGGTGGRPTRSRPAPPATSHRTACDIRTGDGLLVNLLPEVTRRLGSPSPPAGCT